MLTKHTYARCEVLQQAATTSGINLTFSLLGFEIISKTEFRNIFLPGHHFVDITKRHSLKDGHSVQVIVPDITHLMHKSETRWLF